MTIEATLQRANGALTTLSNGRHVWNSDIDKTLGSQDRAPDPHDLLDSALAACTTLTLELYIRRRQLAVTALRVTIDHVEDTDADRQRLLEIADKCPIHRLLSGEIHIESALVATPG